MSYKQYMANPARRMSRFDEAIYLRNERKYDEKITELYRCECHKKATEKQIQVIDRKQLQQTIRETHPDRRDGNDDRREDLENALQKLRKANEIRALSKKRCGRCEMNRQLALQYLSLVEKTLKGAQPVLSPRDFVSSIFYTRCYDRVIAEDMKRHGEGDLTLFADIRRLSNL